MSRGEESPVAGAVPRAGLPREVRGGVPGNAGGGRGVSQAIEPQVCPFCGTINQNPSTSCRQCTLEDTTSTRQATRAKLGPWFVLQTRNPAAPGMNFATLMALVNKGRITPRSIVRGPTTQQMWRFGSQVKGLSRLFGVCWHCGGSVSKSAHVCVACKRLQDAPLNPDVLLEGTDPSGPRVSPAPPRGNAPTHATAQGTVHAPTHSSTSAPAPPGPGVATAEAKLAEQFAMPAIPAQADNGEAEFVINLKDLPAAQAAAQGTVGAAEKRVLVNRSGADEARTETLMPGAGVSGAGVSGARGSGAGFAPSHEAVGIVENPVADVAGMDDAFDAPYGAGLIQHKSRVVPKIFLALLLAIGAFAGVLAYDKGMRDHYWYQARSIWAQWQGDTNFASEPKPALPTYRPKFEVPHDVPLNEPHLLRPSPPATLPEAHQSAFVLRHADPPPVPASAPVAPAPLPARASLPPITFTAPLPSVWPQPNGLPFIPPKVIPPAQPTTASSTASEDALRQYAWRLWSDGVHAQTDRHFSEALRNFEALKTLPEQTWQLGLDERIRQVHAALAAAGNATAPTQLPAPR